MKISTWQDFARVTIQSNDLDPSYVFLWNAKRDKGDEWAARFIIHYLLFYDLGGAVRAAELTSDATFWKYVRRGYDDFRRGTERRHFRADLGMKCVANMSDKGTPTQLWDAMYETNYTGLTQVFKKSFVNCGFGPYFQWKVLDFQERVWERPIILSLAEAVKYCPDDPRKCAKILWPEKDFDRAISDVSDYISQFMAPPSGNRPCSYQEAETVLCMLKGYFITKTHTVGDDVDSKWSQLSTYPEFLKYLPPKQDWSQYERSALDS